MQRNYTKNIRITQANKLMVESASRITIYTDDAWWFPVEHEVIPYPEWGKSYFKTNNAHSIDTILLLIDVTVNTAWFRMINNTNIH